MSVLRRLGATSRGILSSPVAYRAAMAAGKYIGNMYNSHGKGKAKSSTRGPDSMSSAPTTYQHDRIQSYRKKRSPPRRKLRRMKRFDRAVTNVIAKNLGQKFLLTNPYFGTGNAAAGQQSFLDFPMAAGNGSSIPDLENCMVYFNQTAGPWTTAPNLLKLSSITNDIRIRNVTGSGIGVSMDLYYYRTRKDLPFTDAGAGPKYSSVLTATPPFTAGGTQFAFTSLGISPFNASEWCQHFVVTKIVKVELQDGQETTLKLVSRRPYRIKNDSIADFSCLKGVTQGIMVIFRSTINALGGGQACTLAWSSIRSYRGQHMAASEINGAVV